MQKKLIVLLTFTILFIMVAPLGAQGGFYIDSDAEPLETGPIMEAAQPLLNRGATVAIYFVESGESDEFTRRLQSDDLMRGDLIDDSVIAIFVSLNDRYSEIRYGDTWLTDLRPRAEGIKSSALDGNLREGAYTLAFSRVLEDVHSVLTGTFIPPVVSVPTTRIPSSDGGGPNMVIVIMGLAFIFLGPVLRRWMVMLGLAKPASYEGTGPVVAPRYKSNWTSGRRSFGSGRSSVSRSSSSSRSFGGGGRSGGKW